MDQESAALLAADPASPHLAYVNCDENAILCGTWAAGVPTIWHIQLPTPQPDQSRPATTIHIVPLNTSSTTVADIVGIYTSKTYEKVPVYEGAFHPFDGYLAKLGLSQPLAYLLTAFALVPSWAFMIVISLVSRSFMSVPFHRRRSLYLNHLLKHQEQESSDGSSDRQTSTKTCGSSGAHGRRC